MFFFFFFFFFFFCGGCNHKIVSSKQPVHVVFDPVMGDNFASLYNCTPADRGFRLHGGSDIKLFCSLVEVGTFVSVAYFTGAQLQVFFCFNFPVALR